MSAFGICSGRQGKYISAVIPQTSPLQREGDDTEQTSLGTSMVKLQIFPSRILWVNFMLNLNTCRIIGLI